MYSNKENVNILTSVMQGHGIRHVVVCPGSRNAPLVHNFHTSPFFETVAQTDERSAGFLALGLSLSLGEPVAVCVTSGSALLNLLPAVAEATYQKCGLLVISADRPSQWIGQLDGQTMPQTGNMDNFVSKEFSLPEIVDDNTRWHCNRMVNEALLSLKSPARQSVHINVPISEHLYGFDCQTLPAERIIESTSWERVRSILAKSVRPMLVLGQMDKVDVDPRIFRNFAVLAEQLSIPMQLHTDELLCRVEGRRDMDPDVVLYMGGNTISKRLRRYIRRIDALQIVCSDSFHDVSCHTKMIFDSNPQDILKELAKMESKVYAGMWNSLRDEISAIAESFKPRYCGMLAVSMFENAIGENDMVFYANSMVLRYAAIYGRGYRFCNRGLNGIEGSMSVAAGASLVHPGKVFFVTGDLSFFYDENALWQQGLKDNFRIMVINNGGGSIFSSMNGPASTPAFDLISGRHHASTEGVCRQFGVQYLKATDRETLSSGLEFLCSSQTHGPALLEVFTDASQDAAEFKRYYDNFV